MGICGERFGGLRGIHCTSQLNPVVVLRKHPPSYQKFVSQPLNHLSTEYREELIE